MESVSVYNSQDNSPHPKRYLILGGFLLVLVLIAVGTYVFIFKNTKPKANQVVAKIGTENIYQKDLDYELQYAELAESVDRKEYALAKIAQDSRILQEAAKFGILELDDTIYNSQYKDYQKRVQAVSSVKKNYGSISKSLSGYILTHWFFNNQRPGTLGYEKGKERALERISDVREQIVSGEKTAPQIISELQNDETLVEIDPAYKSNVGFPFTVQNTEGPLFDTSFNEKIWSLSSGDVSDIILITDPTGPTNEPKEALYAFAVITGKVNEGVSLPYSEWEKSLLTKYELEIY